MNDRPTAQRIKDATEVTTRASVILEAMTPEQLRAELKTMTTRVHTQQSHENRLRYEHADQIRVIESTLENERRHFCASIKEADNAARVWKAKAEERCEECVALKAKLWRSWSPLEVAFLVVSLLLAVGGAGWFAVDVGWLR